MKMGATESLKVGSVIKDELRAAAALEGVFVRWDGSAGLPRSLLPMAWTSDSKGADHPFVPSGPGTFERHKLPEPAWAKLSRACSLPQAAPVSSFTS